MSERTLHRNTIEAALRKMAANYAALPPALSSIDEHSRVLTVALSEVVMRRYADTLDKGEDLEAFAQGATHALGNVVATLGSFCSDGTPGSKAATTRALCQATTARAWLTVIEPQRQTVVVPIVPS